MSKVAFRDSIINHTIDEFEGGLADHAADRGGLTKYGITRRTYSKYLGRTATAQDMINMPRSHAFKIYRDYYFKFYKVDKLHQAVQHIAFDMYVNHRPSTAGKIIQRALKLGLGIKETGLIDGKIGPKTRAAVEAAIEVFGRKRLIEEVVEYRQQLYNKIVERDKSQAAFIKGWTNRNNWFLNNTLAPPVVFDKKPPKGDNSRQTIFTSFLDWIKRVFNQGEDYHV